MEPDAEIDLLPLVVLKVENCVSCLTNVGKMHIDMTIKVEDDSVRAVRNVNFKDDQKRIN